MYMYLKQGIGSVYVMVYFICKGYLELSEKRVERDLQNEKFLPTVGFEPGASSLRSEGATTELFNLLQWLWNLKFVQQKKIITYSVKYNVLWEIYLIHNVHSLTQHSQLF